MLVPLFVLFRICFPRCGSRLSRQGRGGDKWQGLTQEEARKGVKTKENPEPTINQVKPREKEKLQATAQVSSRVVSGRAVLMVAGRVAGEHDGSRQGSGRALINTRCR